MSYTPGPWQQVGKAVHDARSAQVALCHDQLETTKTHIVYVITGGEAEANARLIAAAPDLLEALRDFMALDRGFTSICDKHLNELAAVPGKNGAMARAVQSARAAIKKAEEA